MTIGEDDPLLSAARARLPAGCALAGGPLGRPPPGPFDEAAPLWRAGDRRRRDFRAGRHYAREALRAMGGPAAAIPARPEGDPVWPDGFVGSISHSAERAYAMVARSTAQAAVGIDFEPDTAVEAELVALVCRPEEIGEQTRGLAGLDVDQAKLSFVAKEAWYKAVFPQARRFIDFLEVCVVFGPDVGRFQVRPVEPGLAGLLPHPELMTGRIFHANGGLLAWVVQKP